jgi:hypothetical protein
MEFNAGRLHLVLDDRTGSITRIDDRQTGLVHLDAARDGRADGRLFRVIVPQGDWISRYADSHEQAPPSVERNGGAATLRFENLRARGEPTGVSVEVRIEPLEGAGEVRFGFRVTNRSEEDVTEVQGPVLGGWTGLGGKGRDRWTLGALQEWDPHQLPHHRGASYIRYHHSRPATRRSPGHSTGSTAGASRPAATACPYRWQPTR